MDELMSAEDLARAVGASERTVERWRYEGNGPAYLKVGHFVRYRRADVEKWLDGRLVTRAS